MISGRAILLVVYIHYFTQHRQFLDFCFSAMSGHIHNLAGSAAYLLGLRPDYNFVITFTRYSIAYTT